MTDWREDEEIEHDRQGEPWLKLKSALLMIGLVAVLLHGIGAVG